MPKLRCRGCGCYISEGLYCKQCVAKGVDKGIEPIYNIRVIPDPEYNWKRRLAHRIVCARGIPFAFKQRKPQQKHKTD